jgi:hypothetical protein
MKKPSGITPDGFFIVRFQRSSERMIKRIRAKISTQISASGIYEGPDFLPTTAGSLCQNPHLRHFALFQAFRTVSQLRSPSASRDDASRLPAPQSRQ